MSYLNGTRFTFNGTFYAAPSTLNNLYPNFESDKNLTDLWNPDGTGEWALRGCTISSAFVNDTPDSSIVGDKVQSIDTPFKACIVDLDTQMQGVSQIWAFRVLIGESDENFYLKGDFEMAPFTDIWAKIPSGQAVGAMGAFYQSVLTNVEWGSNVPAGVLTELQQLTQENMLSIKFNVDSFNAFSTYPNPIGIQPDDFLKGFCSGRIVGTIGPYFSGEPKRFVNGRCINNLGQNAYALIDESNNKLYLDMGNSLQDSAMWGDTMGRYDTLSLVVYDGSNSPVGTINYGSDLYLKTGLIQSFDISSCLGSIFTNSLAIMTTAGGNPFYGIENRSGYFIRADQFVYRLEANSSASVDIYANQFGKPLAQTMVTLAHDNSGLWGVNDYKQGGPQVGVPIDALTFNSATTDSNGKASITLSAGVPGNPRGAFGLDGQIYGVRYYIEGNPASNPVASNYLTIQVYDEYTYSNPTYADNVKAILDQYGWLYPVMASYVDLSDYRSIYANKNQLIQVFSADIESAIHMPVTRDLSAAKRTMLVQWLQADCPEGTPTDQG